VNIGVQCIGMLKCVHFTKIRLSKVAVLKYICLSCSLCYDPYQSMECTEKHTAFSVEKFVLILKDCAGMLKCVHFTEVRVSKVAFLKMTSLYVSFGERNLR